MVKKDKITAIAVAVILALMLSPAVIESVVTSYKIATDPAYAKKWDKDNQLLDGGGLICRRKNLSIKT